ncbi:MAG: SRPBCC family protein [Chloroflexi bacterium]|nr:SRPBCC family protein [Chloroflexota bacterium]
MIKLRDTITIQTSTKRIFGWLESLPKEYVSWHPDHVAYRVIKGSMRQPGSEIECQEHLHGNLHTLRFRLTKVEPDKRMEYEIIGLGKGAFEVIPKDDEVEFVAELGLGSSFPIVGRFVDAVLRVLFHRRLEAMRQHMREEGQNLKKIIESDWKIPTRRLARL